MSDKEETTESPDSKPPEPKEESINVIIKNPAKKETQWNDDKDDIEYDGIILDKEDMDI